MGYLIAVLGHYHSSMWLILPLQTRTQAGRLSLGFLAEKGQVTFTSPFTSERIS